MLKCLFYYLSILLQVFRSQSSVILGCASATIRGKYILAHGLTLGYILTATNGGLKGLAERLTYLWLIELCRAQLCIELGYQYAVTSQSACISAHLTSSHRDVRHSFNAGFLQLGRNDIPRS